MKNYNLNFIIVLLLSSFICEANSANIKGTWQNGYGRYEREIVIEGTLLEDKFAEELVGFFHSDSLLIISGKDSLRKKFSVLKRSNTNFQITISQFIYKRKDENRYREKALQDEIRIILPLKIGRNDIKMFNGFFQRTYSDYIFGREAANFSKYRKKDVTRLHLNYKNLSKGVPEYIFKFPNLKELKLRGLKEGKLPDRMNELLKLEDLEIRPIAYREKDLQFPRQILDIPHLKKMRLEGISSLPEDIDRLQELENLQIYHSTLGEIPSTFGNLSSLKSVDISSCIVTSFPSEMVKLNQLEYLRLACNYFKKNYPYHEYTPVPTEIWQLRNLKELDLMCFDNRSLPKDDDKIRLDSIRKISLNQAYTKTMFNDEVYKEKFGHLIITEIPIFLFQFKTLKELSTYIPVSKIPEEVFTLNDVSVTIRLEWEAYTEAEKEAFKKRYEECCVTNKGKLNL